MRIKRIYKLKCWKLTSILLNCAFFNQNNSLWLPWQVLYLTHLGTNFGISSHCATNTLWKKLICNCFLLCLKFVVVVVVVFTFYNFQFNGYRTCSSAMLFLKEISSFSWMPIQTKGDATMYNTNWYFLSSYPILSHQKTESRERGCEVETTFQASFWNPFLALLATM